MTLRVPLLAAAVAIASSVLLQPATADAQVRVARPRPSVIVGVRPRTTVFIGGYYYPSFYRASLYYGRSPLYYGPEYYYGPAYYQWPPYDGGGWYDLSGSARLQVRPRETEVFIDGYFAGTVDDFDGVLQRLRLEPGEHDLALYLPGHRTFVQRIYLQPGRTFRIRHTMEPLAPGEAEPARPDGGPIPQGGPARRGPERRPGPESRAPSPGFGELALRVQPADADVLIDGERWEGAADAERLVVQLGAGTHHLEIRKEGYRGYLTDITVRSGETMTLNVALSKQ